MSDQLSHGVILDVIEQQAELTLEGMDYENFAPGKPYKSGTLTFPETANNRAALGSLYDTDGANKVRIIEDVTYDNEVTTLKGSLVITGQSFENRINSLTGFFIAGNGLLWLDFGDTKLTELDWSAYDHVLNITNQQAGNDLVKYDICDRGQFVDTDAINMIERYPAMNLSEMFRVIFKDYDLKSNFIGQDWFDEIYLLFTQSNNIRNTEEWEESSLISGSGEINENDNTLYMYGVTVDWDKSGDFYQTTFIAEDEYDNGLNWDSINKVYKIPESGTYRFKLTIDGDAYLRDEVSGVPTGLIVYAQFEVKLKINDDYIVARVFVDDNDGSNHGEFVFNNYIIDTDFIELNKDDELSIHAYYNVRIHPIVLNVYWTNVFSLDFTLTNQVSRYYGYGSNVDISRLMPDIKVNEWLKMIFQHFAIMPQYSYETNIVRLNVWQRQQLGYDLTTFVDTGTASADYNEAFEYELKFAADRGDRYAEFWYLQNPSETGDYKSNGNSKVKKVFTSDFSNTIMQICYQNQNSRDEIPTLWQEVPKDALVYANVPKYKTTYNYRLVQYTHTIVTMPISYHVAGEGRHVSTEDLDILTPVGLEFTDLHDQLHAAYIARLNNGTTLTINARLPLSYLNLIINNDENTNLYTPVYIGINPYIGSYTVGKIVTNGVITQFTLILNNE